MALVTLRVLDGPERGRIFNQMVMPVTLGREDGNSIQLNDERISRYHLRITEDGDAILLTDLQSTNGTRVNGEAIHLWRLRPGDLVSVGRSQILFGSATEIAERLRVLRKTGTDEAIPMGCDGLQVVESALVSPEGGAKSSFFNSSPLDAEIFRNLTQDDIANLHKLAAPELPVNLPLKQSAQLAEFLQYIQLRLRYLVTTVNAQNPDSNKDANVGSVSLEQYQWQNLLDLYGRIALYLHAVTDP
jgi:pSer/pThr/pTyr-binding forkhead associated (FHA) protein